MAGTKKAPKTAPRGGYTAGKGRVSDLKPPAKLPGVGMKLTPNKRKKLKSA